MAIRGLISSFRSTSRSSQNRAIELLAVSGLDVGRRFTVFADAVEIVRGFQDRDNPHAVYLRDRTVSVRQALLRFVDGAYRVEHHLSATNPTLVNGEPIDERRLRAGDRLQVGRVVFEVQRPRASQSGMFEVVDQAGATQSGVAAASASENPEWATVETPAFGLSVVFGAERATHPLHPGQTLIGRSPTCEIALESEAAISREHARIERDGERLTLVHLSRVNPTRVNGRNIVDRQQIVVGDEIEIAGRIMFRLVGPDPGAAAPANLADHMEELIQHKQDIAARFAVTGSFLDVDIVRSFQLKSDTHEPERIILSFERWRGWVTAAVREHGGDVLNSNGDELMTFFESPLAALRAGHAILADLARFNAEENLLDRAFQLRLGIHTGHSLVDRSRGVAYSPVLDVTGHLQKAAPVDGLLLSEATLSALPDPLPAPLQLVPATEVDSMRCYALQSATRDR